MHIVLTDLLTCPRCGPEYGLILLAQEAEARRVRSGSLGCSNCRERYAVRDGEVGFAGSEAEAEAEAEVDVMRIGALLGVTHGPAFVLVTGPAAASAARLAELIEDIEVVAVNAGVEAAVGVNPVAGVGERLPFASGKLVGVALTGESADRWLEEGVRVLSPTGRLVLEPAPADAGERLEALRLRVLARDERGLVAARY